MMFHAVYMMLLGGSCGTGKQLLFLQVVAMVYQMVAMVSQAVVRWFLYYTRE